MTLPELLYYAGYSIHKRFGTKNRKRLPCKVISIGNITLGGTGKTPAAIALALEAKARGFQPCILTRGYKGKIKGPFFVSNGGRRLPDASRAGDEAVLMAEKLEGLPVVKGGDRYEAGMFALERLKIKNSKPGSELLFIMDDGFQHWGLSRNKDILLVDSRNPFGNRRLLPLGYLREPLSAMSRADIVVLTNADKAGGRDGEPEVPSAHPSSTGGDGRGGSIVDLIGEIRQYNPEAPVFFACHRPVRFYAMTKEILPLEWATGKTFYVFCGIGNPSSFRDTLTATGADIRGIKIFRDHYAYSAGDIRAITEEAEKCGAAWIVTTEKDIMRLMSFDLPGNLVSLAIEFQVENKFYDEVFAF
jgi:tetraacyldisaccharide 4'-kinase